MPPVLSIIDGRTKQLSDVIHDEREGDIVFLELPEVGTELEENATFGVVESIKSVSDIYSPLKGKVSSVNSNLLDTPEKCNEEPYEAWLVKIKIDTDADHNLMSAEEYTEFVQQSH